MTPIVVFARAPIPGRVKTRLARAVGPAAAARIYAHMLVHTVTVAVEAAPGAVWLYATPDCSHPLLARLVAQHGLTPARQRGVDLGARMLDAVRRTIDAAGACVLVGSDCPGLTARDLREAATALETGADLVLAPSADGGYALIGLRRAEPTLFEGVPWSTRRVAAVTRRRAAELGWRRHELRVMRDIDEPRDLALLPAHWGWPEAAPIF